MENNVLHAQPHAHKHNIPFHMAYAALHILYANNIIDGAMWK